MKKLINILINFSIFILLNYEISGSETLQITTYYPAPYGGYTRLLTTDTTLLARDSGNVGIGTNTIKTPAPNGQRGNIDANDVYIRSINKWVSQISTQFQIITFSYSDCNTYCCPSGFNVIAAGGFTNGVKNLNTIPVNQSCMYFREGFSCGQSGIAWMTCVKN